MYIDFNDILHYDILENLVNRFVILFSMGMGTGMGGWGWTSAHPLKGATHLHPYILERCEPISIHAS